MSCTAAIRCGRSSAEAERAPIVERVGLERFTREEIVAQLTGILGRRPEARLVDELFARAEGNPFFTEELAAAATGERLPANVADALMLRVEALSPAAQAVLRLAAVAGPRVSHGLLERASGLGPDELVAGLREAVAHNIVVADPETDAYGFRHALMREALADDLLPGERGPLHAALARALESDPALSVSPSGVTAELAFHWFAAHNLPAAFTASAQAGAEATRLAAFAEANAHYERAIELWDGVPEDVRAAGRSLVDLIRDAAEAANLAGEYARAAALGRRALSLVDADADPMTAALIGERLGRYLWISGNSHEALAECRAAVARLPQDGDPAGRARVLGSEGHLLLLLGRGAEALAALPAGAGDRAHRRRAPRGGQHPQHDVRRARATPARWKPGSSTATRPCASPARATTSRRSRAPTSTSARPSTGPGASRRRPISRARERSARSSRASARWPLCSPRTRGCACCGWGAGTMPTPRWPSRSTRRSAGSRRGPRWPGGRCSTPCAGASANRETRSTRPSARRRTPWGRCGPGRWPSRGPSSRSGAGARTTRATPSSPCSTASSRPTRTPSTSRPSSPSERAPPPTSPSSARATGDAQAEREAVALAATLVDRARHLVRPEAFPAGRCPPEALLNVATTQAEHARAAGHGAAQRGATSPRAGMRSARPTRPRTRAGAWPRRSSPMAARAPTPRPRWRPPTRSPTGCARARSPRSSRRWRRRARLSLDSGAAPAAVPADGDGAAERVGFTARELEVLRLVAAGETNRSIGQALYISEKTVSVHISRILAKLDVRGRVEAAGLALRLGLLEETEA